MIHCNGEFLKMSDKEESYVEKTGYITIYEIFKQYGISKQKTYRAIRSGKLNAFMNGSVDKNGSEFVILKWYIIKDDLFNDILTKYEYRDVITVVSYIIKNVCC